jgi:hypothetical protein
MKTSIFKGTLSTYLTCYFSTNLENLRWQRQLWQGHTTFLGKKGAGRGGKITTTRRRRKPTEKDGEDSGSLCSKRQMTCLNMVARSAEIAVCTFASLKQEPAALRMEDTTHIILIQMSVSLLAETT